MAYNRYYDLTPMERIRQANEEYRRVSLRNISEQAKLNEEKLKEPEYEGQILGDDEGPDVSSELTIIDDNFRFLNSNILKLRTFVDPISKSGAKKKKNLVAPVAPTAPDPNDAKYQRDLDPNNNGVNDPEYTKDENKYLKEVIIYDKELILYNEKMLNLVLSIPSQNINTYVDNITKCIYNLESINSNTKDIIKIIIDTGEENFNFSQFNDTYKLYNKFLIEYTKFYQFFYTGGISIFEEALQYGGSGTKNLDILNDYTTNFNDACVDVIKLYEGIKVVSREKGTRKVQYEGAGRYRDQRVYHSAWM